MRILVVEDDPGIADVLQRGLVMQYYQVDIAHDGNTGQEMALVNDYDLLILDVLLPGKSGREVCDALRRKGIATPILMLTALDSPEDKIGGLDSGADDYLTKPFHFGELLARVRSLMRRQSEQKTAEISVADLVMDTSKRSVRRRDIPIALTAKEFALLEYFIANKDRVLTREMISEHVWDMNFDPRSNVIDSFVRFLRQKIDRDFSPPLIHTVRGVGYRFSETGER